MNQTQVWEKSIGLGLQEPHEDFRDSEVSPLFFNMIVIEFCFQRQNPPLSSLSAFLLSVIVLLFCSKWLLQEVFPPCWWRTLYLLHYASLPTCNSSRGSCPDRRKEFFKEKSHKLNFYASNSTDWTKDLVCLGFFSSKMAGFGRGF